MRLREPRIAPLEESAWTAEQREIVGKASLGEPINIFKTLVRHPKLLKRYVVFAGHVLNKSTLPARDREIVILRIGWLCRAEYEWGQHVPIAKEAGISDEEIAAIREGPDADGWSGKERALLRATDELREAAFVGEETWNALREHYSDEQLIDLLFAIGNYNLVSMVLNTLGVQLDPGVKGFEG